ncbi:MAG: hypothetical protein ACRESK_07015 [Gammaproteobacteria bacterium]
MSKVHSFKPLVAAMGATFAVSLAASPIVNAEVNPFQVNELSGGFMVAEAGKCGSICGGEKPTFNEKGEMVKCGGSCGEVAKCGTICGGAAMAKATAEGKSTDEIAKCGNFCAAVK